MLAKQATLVQNRLDSVHPCVSGEHLHLTSLVSSNPVHPRVSGEHEAGHQVWSTIHGSSPRERGTLLQQSHRHWSRRFIPA